MALCAALAVAMMGCSATADSATVMPQADYLFQHTLASSLGTPPALTDLGPGRNSFATDIVNGSPDLVLTFPFDNGVQLAPTTGVIANDAYTIAVLLRFATVNRGEGWVRIVDFKDGTSDRGLYAHGGVLELYPDAKGARATIGAGAYVQVVLTRNSAGTVVGYVNGARQFSFDDSVLGDALIDSRDTLRFFRDNEIGITPNEASPGAVARIRLYDQALTAQQVAALSGLARPTGIVRTNVARLSFAPQPLGRLSTPRILVVTNVGHDALPIDRVRMKGADPNDFLLSSDGCSNLTLLVGRSCSIGVRFAPSVRGVRTATLSVSSADLHSSLVVSLSGRGRSGRASG